VSHDSGTTYMRRTTTRSSSSLAQFSQMRSTGDETTLARTAGSRVALDGEGGQ
jgi:hypothetical protein